MQTTKLQIFVVESTLIYPKHWYGWNWKVLRGSGFQLKSVETDDLDHLRASELNNFITE